MKNKFNGYKEYISSLLISFLIALLISIAVFTAIYLCVEKIINEYVSSDSYIYNTQAAYITDFQKYVSDNKVSSNDFKSIDTWIQREKPEFFLISIDNETHYVSTEFLCLKKPQNLSLYNQKISVYLKALNFSDRTAKIFIYNNYQEKYLKALLICDALFTLITAIMILFFISMVPIVELRGAIPYSVVFGLPLIPSYIICVIGNMLPVPFIYLFARKILIWGSDKKGIGKFFRFCLEKGEKGGQKLKEKAGRGTFVALFLFVGVPLPGTGAWTGTLAASLLDMDFKSSILACMGGVLLAGVIMAVVSTGVFSAILALF